MHTFGRGGAYDVAIRTEYHRENAGSSLQEGTGNAIKLFPLQIIRRK